MQELLNAYDELITGKRTILGVYYFPGDHVGGINEKNALIIIKYALEYLLGWTIEKSVRQFDEYIISLMKLEKIIRYIDYPFSVISGNPRYILSLLYPDIVKYSEKQQILDTYRYVLKNNLQFPRSFFSGEKGKYRYQLCLRYCLTHYKSFQKIGDIYCFFSTSEGNAFLEEFRLKSPAQQYQIDIHEIVYLITILEENSLLYYCYYKFMDENNTIFNSD